MRVRRAEKLIWDTRPYSLLPIPLLWTCIGLSNPSTVDIVFHMPITLAGLASVRGRAPTIDKPRRRKHFTMTEHFSGSTAIGQPGSLRYVHISGAHLIFCFRSGPGPWPTHPSKTASAFPLLNTRKNEPPSAVFIPVDQWSVLILFRIISTAHEKLMCLLPFPIFRTDLLAAGNRSFSSTTLSIPTRFRQVLRSQTTLSGSSKTPPPFLTKGREVGSTA